MTTIRLVREAEIQLRRPCLHLIPLELTTLSPRPITLVSLQGRLPNLHRLRSSAIHNYSWMLRTRRLSGWRITVLKCNKSLVHSEQNDFSDAQSLWLWVILAGCFLSKASRMGCSHTTIAVFLSWSSHQLWCRGGVFIPSGQPEVRCTK